MDLLKMTTKFVVFVTRSIWLKQHVIIYHILALIIHVQVFCGMTTITLPGAILKI